MLTGVVLARNEAANIVDCLKSLRPYVSELLLIDMESTDQTRELAQPLVDRILTHRLIPHFDSARNIANTEAAHEWIWFLDADERVSEATGRLVQRVLQEQGADIAAITIPFKTYFSGKWMQHCGWWPGYTMPRVLKRGRFRFADRLHGGVQFDGRELRLPPDPELAIEHFSYRSIEHYFEKFNRYTTGEALTLAEQGEPTTWDRGMRAMVRDLWLYFERNEGRRDGAHGWILSWLAGQYRWCSHAKLLDLPHDKAADSLPDQVPSNLDEVLHVMEEELALLRSNDPELPLGIVWRSPIWDPSGYAEDSRLIVRAIAQGERSLSVEPINWSDAKCGLPNEETALLKALAHTKRPPFAAVITNCIPTLCRPARGAALNILRTTFETDRIPANWLPIIDSFDEVWGFSQLDRLRFRRSGVAPEKIRILNGYVDTDRFTSEGGTIDLPAPMQDRFVFLSVFDWQYRKGWDVLLKAYCSEFAPSDQMGLLLKVSSSHGYDLEAMRRQANEVLATLSTSLEEREDIVIWDQTLEAAAMAALYRSVDAFVLASRGEGWGRPYMEAMASGLPTIGVRGSGNDDFMSESNSFLIEADLVDVPGEAAEEIPVYRGHRWLEPNLESLVAQLRLVATNHDLRAKVAEQGCTDVRTRFSVGCANEAVERNVTLAERKFVKPDFPDVRTTQTRVELEGELFARHSFSNINEKLASEFLGRDDIALSIRRLQYNPTYDRESFKRNVLSPYIGRPFGEAGAQVTIRHAFPPNWTPPETGRWVHIQPWEFGALPRDWIPPLRDQVDEIWAPSNYVKQVYVDSGISPDKIRVIPWGVSAEAYNPEALPLLLPTEKSFRFLFVGGTIARKGIDTLLDAYTSEFSADDDVCLVIKDMGAQTFYRYGNERERILSLVNDRNAPEILYLDREMSEGQLASLYTACHCLAAPYRGEGFGLPILEAMACGLPSIVPAGGASDDFVTPETGYLLPAAVVECEHDWRLCQPATQLSIEQSDLADAMRHVQASPEECRSKGRRASDVVREQYSWKRTANHMVERINDLTKHGPSNEREARDSSPTAADAPQSLTVCTLAENNESTIGDSLARVQSHVAEMIVLDLGSTDSTPQIAAEYGARVYQGCFNGSLSELRNATLRRATSDWILVLDADERLGDQDVEKVTTFINRASPETFGATTSVLYSCEPPNTPLAERVVRLFRNHNDVIFETRGCEHIEGRIQRLRGRVVDTDIEIARFAEEPSQGTVFRRPRARLELLQVDRLENPKNSLIDFHLGNLHYGLGNYFHAECYLNDALARLQPEDSLFGSVASLLIKAHEQKGDPERALEVAEFAKIAHGANEFTALDEAPLTEPTDQRLYLGAGQKRLNGYTHVDLNAGDGVDIAHDLSSLPWPWEDGSVTRIVAEDLVEHLDIDVVQFCNEAWRVLQPGGELFIRTPHHKGESSWIDPTHRWHLDERAFEYLDPETHWGNLYPQYTDRKWRLLSLGVRGPQNIHVLLTPRK